MALLTAHGCCGFAPTLTLSEWLDHPPIEFYMDGRNSRDFLGTWTRTESNSPSPGGVTQRTVYSDQKSQLKVTVDIRTFSASGSKAIDWVVWMKNEGASDTPILEGIKPLAWTLGPVGSAVLHHARGSSAKLEDFEPLHEALIPGASVRLESEKGLSSSGSTLPYFNLQTDGGGAVAAIGWTGGWEADFARSKDGSLAVTAGMKRTHLRLRPGEEIRSPRIVILPWEGSDWQAAQNQWRRLVLSYYSPQVAGHPLAGPVMFGSWGSEPIAKKLDLIASMVAHRMPFDTYAVDAGWYGNSRGETEDESEKGRFPWWRQRGDWWPSPLYYPDGLAPLGDALRANGLGFSLWIEPETAEPGTRFLTDHPDWYLHVPNAINEGAALLNLGNPEARQGITRLVSNILTTARVTWYRQDFNIPPEKYWELADAPDRVGMTEIQHIEGLYLFWDQLRAEHRDLVIDNCASGGRRLDLEMMSRSFAVWRSDFGCADDVEEQMQTQALSPWVPQNMGIETLWTSDPWKRQGPFGSAADVYAMRCGYSAGFASNPGPAGTRNDSWLAFEARALSEYREVQPYFYGDFYPLLPYSIERSSWTAWQWNRPDLNAGVVLILRRPESPMTAMNLALHALDPAAQYEVDTRQGFDPGAMSTMSGEALSHLPVSLSTEPGSLLILYRRRINAPQINAEGSGTAPNPGLLPGRSTVDLANPTSSPILVVFEDDPRIAARPSIVRLGPQGHGSVELTTQSGAQTASVAYSVTPGDTPASAADDLYQGDRSGETVGIVPIEPELYDAVLRQVRDIFWASRERVTDPSMPPDTFIYTPSPYYRQAGVFARDFLFQLEGCGRSAVTADEVKRAVDFMASKQLRARHQVRDCTFPAGAIPDRVRPDGQVAWGPGPGDALGDRIGGYHRPSMDESMCFVTLAWHYGSKAGWNEAWRSWFGTVSGRLEAAWDSVPRNPSSGLVTQWTTPGHIGGDGITETNGPCVMWGFHDSYGFPGDDVGTSVLACNAARSLADMYRHAGNKAAAGTWADRAQALQEGIRAQFKPVGYLPWGVGTGAPTMASPDITGYAVWSRILSDDQADAASDWFAARYRADRTAGGAADLFNMTPGLRGSVRMARRADDVYPGSHVWPHTVPPHWENLTFGYNAYQDGGYWYYMSLGMAATLWRKHPSEAKEWAENACRDLIAEGGNYPYERVDGSKPVNFRYNASAGALLGMVRPATEFSFSIGSSAPAATKVP